MKGVQVLFDQLKKKNEIIFIYRSSFRQLFIFLRIIFLEKCNQNKCDLPHIQVAWVFFATVLSLSLGSMNTHFQITFQSTLPNVFAVELICAFSNAMNILTKGVNGRPTVEMKAKIPNSYVSKISKEKKISPKINKHTHVCVT